MCGFKDSVTPAAASLKLLGWLADVPGVDTTAGRLVFTGGQEAGDALHWCYLLWQSVSICYVVVAAVATVVIMDSQKNSNRAPENAGFAGGQMAAVAFCGGARAVRGHDGWQ